MRNYMKCLALLACVFLLSSCGFTRIRLGVADIGGKYYTFGEGYADYLKKNDREIEVRKTAGSSANLRLLSDGLLELGISQSDLIADALSGSGVFQGKPLSGFSAVSELFTETCQLIVRADSDIQEIDDLFDRAVSVGEADSGTESFARQLLAIHGLGPERLDMKNLKYEEAASALENGTIDAAFCIAGGAIKAFSDLSERVPLRLLPVSMRKSSALLRSNPYYIKTSVPAGLYKGQEETESLGVRAVLLASDKLDTATVKSLTEILYAYAKGLGLDLSRDLDLRLHPGAKAFFEEAGLLPPE